MTQTETPSQHTSTPWRAIKRSRSYIDIVGGERPAGHLATADPGEISVEQVCRVHNHMPGEANERLIIATANSYDKHCGARAVECAEDDLLGELLEAARGKVMVAEVGGEYLPSRVAEVLVESMPSVFGGLSLPIRSCDASERVDRVLRAAIAKAT